MSEPSYVNNSYFLIMSVVGLVFIIMGLWMFLKPPKKINYLIGYRTKNSMRNQDNWNFAQKFAAKVMIIIGVLMGLLAFISPLASHEFGVWGALAFIILSGVILIFLTENAIKKRSQQP